MDNKITKRRLVNLLSYDWIKIIVLVFAVVLAWSLAFTIGAPRASVGQVFNVFYYGSFSYVKGPDGINNEAKKAGAYSYDVLDIDSREIFVDYYATIMTAVDATAEGDIMITTDSVNKIEECSSEFRNFIDGYGAVVYDYDRLILDAKNYCLSNNFVVLQPDGSYLLNSQAITEYFAQRMKKDPRFKDTKSDKYKQGILDEIARIKSVWNNAVMLEDCLSNHPEIRYNYARYTQLVKSDPENYTEDAYHNTKELTYGINLGALTGGAVDVNSEYSKVVLDENGEIASTSANNVIICVFNYSKQQPDLQFETLGFVNFMIARYSNFLNVNAPLVIA